jgi:hypothetical protein
MIPIGCTNMHEQSCTIHVNSLHHFDYKYAHIYHQHPPRYSTTAPHATEHVSSFFTNTGSSKCSLLDLSPTITICFTYINQTLFKILQQFLCIVCHILAQGCRNRGARLDYPINLQYYCSLKLRKIQMITGKRLIWPGHRLHWPENTKNYYTNGIIGVPIKITI